MLKVTDLVNWLEGKGGAIAAVLIIIVMISGIVYSLYLGNELRFLPDEQDYYDLATNIAQSYSYSLDDITPTAYRPPGYPLFLSFPRFLGGGVIVLRILNFFILGFGIYLTYKILQREHSGIAGLIGVVLIIGYPVIFFTSGTLYPQILASVLFLLIIYIYTGESDKAWIYALCGVLFGFLIITVPTFIFTLLLFPVWLGRKKKQFVGYLIMIGFALIILGLWGMRNYIQFNKIIFVSTNSGENLLLGNSENTTPNGGRTIDISKYSRVAASLDEVERDQYYRSAAFEYMRKNTSRSIQIYLLKVLNYFNFRNDLVTRSEGSQLRDILVLITYGFLLSAFILRIFLYKMFKITNFERNLIVLYVTSALFMAIFFTRIRFRIPYDFLLILIVALFIAKLVYRYLLKSEPKVMVTSG